MLGVGPGPVFWSDAEKANSLCHGTMLDMHEAVIMVPRALPSRLKSLSDLVLQDLTTWFT